MGDYEKATQGATKASTDQTRIEQELTERRRLATEAAIKRKEAEAEYKRVMADSNATAEQQIEAEQRRNKAMGEHMQAARRAADAERALSAAVAGNKQAVDKFINSLDRSSAGIDRHTSKMRDMRLEAQRLSQTMSSLSGTLSHVFTTLGKGLAITGAIGAAGGLAGLLGAGGIQGAMVGLGGLASVIAQFSGSLLLIPAGVAGAVASIGTLTLAFKGVGEALKSMSDPAKFAESLQKLGPATREFVLQIYQFRDVFRGFKQTIQDGLFGPLITEVEPLVRDLLPTLMEGLRSVANAFGELGAGFAQFLRAPETVEAISIFLGNMASALKAIQPGMLAFSEAMRTLAVVGSSFFPQLAQSFNSLATNFKNWIDGLNASGKLQEWIQNGINAFGQLGRIIRDTGIAIANIFNISGTQGGALLWLETIAAKFRAWTESVEGNQAISGFFAKVREATDALLPILKVVGSALATVVGSLVDTGIDTQSGLLSFFTSLGEALKIFGETMKSSGPQINQLLTLLGQTLLDIVKAIGPQLPSLFQSFADVLKTLAPILVTIVEKVAQFLGSLSSEQLQGLVIATISVAALAAAIGPLAGLITGLTTVIGGLTAAFAFFASPVGLVILALAAVVAIGVLVYKNWDSIKEMAGELWGKLQEFASWLGNAFTTAWNTLVATISGVWETIKSTLSNAIGGIKDQFLSMVSGAVDWGKKLIGNFVDGIIDSVPGLRGALDWVASIIPDFLETNSPAKRGPLNRVSPNRMGEKLVENFSAGIKNAAPMVRDASSTVASGFAPGGGGASQGGGGSSGSIAGTTGSGSSGSSSGLQDYVKGVTGELSQWGKLFQNVAQIALGLVESAVQTIKVIGALWSDGKNTGKMGDNPLTRPGGLLSGDKPAPELPEQKFVDGVPMAKPMKEDEPVAKPIPSMSPDTYLDPKKAAEAKLPPQKNVPRKPQKPPTVTTQAQARQFSMESAKSGGVSSGRYGTKPSMFLVHTEDGNQGGRDPQQLATWMKGQGDRSYHYIVNADGSTVVNPVNPDEAAWSVGPQGNSKSINAVFGGSWGEWTRDQWLGNSREAIRTMAALAVQNAEQYGIPLDMLSSDKSSGIGGHSWVSEQLGGTDHTDPGPGFPWDVFQSDIAAAAAGTGLSNGAPVKPDYILPGEDGYVEAQQMKGGTAPGGMRTFGPRPRTPGGGGNPPRPKPGPKSVVKGSTEFGVGPNANIQYGAAGFPSWVYQLGDMFGVEATTYGGHQTDGANGQIASGPVVPNPKGLNRGIDWRPKGMDIFSQEGSAVMEKFSQFLMDKGLAEQVIYQSAASGKQFGFPFNSDYSASYPGHINHLHTRFGNNLQFGQGGKGNEIELTTPKPLEVNQKVDGAPWNPNAGVRGAQQIPLTPTGPGAKAYDEGKRRGQIGIPDTSGLAVDAGGAGGIAAMAGGGAGAGAAGAMSAIEMVSGIASDAGQIIGDVFQVFNSTLTAIDATADLSATAIRGFENTEDVYKAVDQIQTYIALGADISKLVSSISGTAAKYVGMGAAADTSGATAGVAAALGAVSAISGLVQTGLETTNAVIDLGQEAYRMAAKYGAKAAGIMLGGPETGPLGGNVRMLLNTNTGQLMAYSEDNALNKSTKNLPDWFSRAYEPSKVQPVSSQTQMNIYTGPGSDPKNLIADTMWLANYGAPSVASVAGRN
jgi:phage-related protein